MGLKLKDPFEILDLLQMDRRLMVMRMRQAAHFWDRFGEPRWRHITIQLLGHLNRLDEEIERITWELNQ